MRVPVPARFVLSALTLAAVPLVAHADAVIARQTVYFDKLRIQLIDLDVSDDITPTFSYDMQMFVSDGDLGLRPTVQKNPEALLPSEPFSYTSEDGTRQLSLGPDSIRVTTAVTLEQAVQGRTFAETGSVQSVAYVQAVMQGLSLAASMTPQDNIALPAFTLSPQTQVVITGDAGYSHDLDASALNQWLGTSGYDTFTLREYGAFYGVLAQFRAEGETVGEWYEGDPESYALMVPDTESLSVDQTTDGGVGAGASGSFSITFNNATNASASGLLMLTAVSNPSLELTLTRSTLPTPVPEPASWALMGLGLALGAVAMRKQRHAGQR